MATVGSLAVNVVARTGSLQRGLTKGRALVRSFAVAAAAGAAAATVAARAMVSVFNDVAPQIDEISKAAGRLDMTTESLAGLGHAATLSGSSVSELAKGLTLMHRNIADAATGIGTATPALDRLGLSAAALKQLSADEMFLQIADAINKLPTAAERTSAAMDIFGRSGANLLPLMLEGRAGIEAMMAEAQRLGITFSAEQGRMVEAANDAMDKIGIAIGGLKNQLAIGLAPTITVLSESFAQWVASLNSGTEGINKTGGAAQAFAGKMALIGDVIHTVRLGFVKLQAVITSVLAWIVRKITDVVSFAVRSINKLPGVEIDDPQFINALADELERTSDDLNSKFDKLFVAKTPSERMAAMLDGIQEKAEETRDVVAQVPAAISEGLGPSELHRIGTAIDDMLADFKMRDTATATPLRPRQSLGIVERGTREGFMHATGRGGQDAMQKLNKTNADQLQELKKLNSAIGPSGHGFKGDITVNTHHIA